MKLGVTIHATDQTMDTVQLAREVEARGFYSFYIPEHTHIPTSRRTPAPTGEEVLSEEYKRSLDPYVALGAVSSVTEKLLLGVGIALVAQHDPITMAKEIATVDHLSGGRFVLGIGYGWNHEEMENHGIDVRRRRARVREHMLAMEALWKDEVASFSGEFVSFEPSWQWPKPVQQPRPRVLIGGAAGPKLFAHIAEYADGWLPIGGAGIRKSLSELERAMEERGRDPKSLHIAPMGVFPNPEKLDYYRESGCTECVFRLPAGPRDTVMPVLDEYAGYL